MFRWAWAGCSHFSIRASSLRGGAMLIFSIVLYSYGQRTWGPRCKPQTDYRLHKEVKGDCIPCARSIPLKREARSIERPSTQATLIFSAPAPSSTEWSLSGILGLADWFSLQAWSNMITRSRFLPKPILVRVEIVQTASTDAVSFLLVLHPVYETRLASCEPGHWTILRR